MGESEEFYRQLDIELEEWRKSEQYKKLIMDFPSIVEKKKFKEFYKRIIQIPLDLVDDCYVGFTCPIYLSNRIIYIFKKDGLAFFNKVKGNEMLIYLVFDSIVSGRDKISLVNLLSKKFKVDLKLSERPLIAKYDSRNVGDSWMNHFLFKELLRKNEYFKDIKLIPTVTLEIIPKDEKNNKYRLHKSNKLLEIEEGYIYDRNR